MSGLALFGGSKAKTKPFPPWPLYGDEEYRALKEVLESRHWWRTPGTKTKEFEEDFATYQQAKYGIAVTNGTHAIEVVLAALEVGHGDEVIVPDFTFVATASAVLSVGALPVLVDVTEDTYCIDLALAEMAITPRTKAIIAVHMGGHPADLDGLIDLARKYDLYLIEDSAHAHGSEWKNRKVGNFGIAATFSFQASKLMTAGEGGIIITNDEEIEQKARSVHDCGRMPGKWFYDHFIYGSNYRLSEWQGAVLLAQLGRLEEQVQKRHRNALFLDDLLSGIAGITPQRLDARCTRNSHYGYIYYYDRSAFEGISTERFIKAINAEGIPNQASYPPIHALDIFQSGAYKRRLVGEQPQGLHPFLLDEFPITERAAWETVWIPQYALLGDEQDMQEIVSAILKVQRNAKELVQRGK